MAKRNMSVSEMRAEVARLEKQIRAATVQKALRDIAGTREFRILRERFAKLGISAQVIGQLFTRDTSTRRTSGGARVSPKYEHPKNPDLRWTGRGRKPKWVEQCLDEGLTLEDLLINKEVGA